MDKPASGMVSTEGCLREYASPLSYASRLLDVVAALTGSWLAYALKFGDFSLPENYQIGTFYSALLVMLVFPMSGLYRSWRGKSWFHQIRTIVISWVSVVSLLIASAFLMKISTLYSREWLVYWVAITLLILFVYRFSFNAILTMMRKKGFNNKRLLIIGAGKFGQSIVTALQDKKCAGYHIIGYLDDDPQLHGRRFNGVPCLASIDNIETMVNEYHIDEILIALPLKSVDRVKTLLQHMRHSTTTIRLAPNVYEFALVNYSVARFFGLHVLNLTETPMYGINASLKDLEDKILSVAILIFISPLLLLIAIAIKLNSPGPVLYKQERISWNNKPFQMLKFRSMPVDTERKTGPTWATESESRATTVGAFLRKTSLDELPQFINVLRGDMSIVGPRPERPMFVNQFKNEIDQYMQKHLVKAGITGWAQVNGLRGNTNLKKRIKYDLHYVENWSLFFDIRIIFLTIIKGFVHKNAY